MQKLKVKRPCSLNLVVRTNSLTIAQCFENYEDKEPIDLLSDSGPSENIGSGHVWIPYDGGMLLVAMYATNLFTNILYFFLLSKYLDVRFTRVTKCHEGTSTCIIRKTGSTKDLHSTPLTNEIRENLTIRMIYNAPFVVQRSISQQRIRTSCWENP